MSNPTVSVILPVYNGEEYLRFAVESVLNQTFQDYELIIIDDGSVDSTPSIAHEYGSRVRYVRQENTGVAGAFNHGLRLASGRYISWLSHDDVFMPAKLEKQVNAIGQVDGPAVCYTDIEMIDSQGRIVAQHRLPQYGREEALRHVLTSGSICSASYSILYDRRCLDEVGMYAEARRYTQDVDMLARLVERFPFVRVPELLMQVRDHQTRAVRSKVWEREALKFFRERLSTTPIEKLFPGLRADASKAEKAEAYLLLGDTLAAQPYPFYLTASSPYRRSLATTPSQAVLLRFIRLYFNHLRNKIKGKLHRIWTEI